MKSEVRSSKFETNPKLEFGLLRPLSCLQLSLIGEGATNISTALYSIFEFRISNFTS